MNTRERAIELNMKISRLIEVNKGEITICLFNGTNISVRVLNKHSNWTPNDFTCLLTTFTIDINQTTLYDINQIKDAY